MASLPEPLKLDFSGRTLVMFQVAAHFSALGQANFSGITMIEQYRVDLWCLCTPFIVLSSQE